MIQLRSELGPPQLAAVLVAGSLFFPSIRRIIISNGTPLFTYLVSGADRQTCVRHGPG
ncbi:uncharacterized protein BDW47DRAFT_104980 [Aspergillus candidus]|uniref:Uncharacterized protein n=1 Tax=Aspergillus candidus TaxID=41067 RepID=A0A2I2FD56_ASPCN|nr:hypothetical protein BDW47DRAFT_104980 [Aspergillus candidus]PLB38519.1 hypothetical protein BDW47DRAFT_104980 [Aspergillus candidus]